MSQKLPIFPTVHNACHGRVVGAGGGESEKIWLPIVVALVVFPKEDPDCILCESLAFRFTEDEVNDYIFSSYMSKQKRPVTRLIGAHVKAIWPWIVNTVIVISPAWL